MKFIYNLTPSRYMSFISSHPLLHYMKTPMWANFKKSDIHLVGLEENNQLIATALILEKKWFGKSYFYIPTGPCLDFNQLPIFKTFLDYIKKFAKEKKAFMIRMDPNIQRCSRDIKGVQTDDFSNEFVTDFLLQEGFQHKGYGYAYNGSWTNRFSLILDINRPFDEIFKNISKSRQNTIRRQEKTGISTRIASFDELNHLCILEKDLSLTQGFKPHPLRFFQNLYKAFENHVQFYITEMNLKARYAFIAEEINSKKYAKDLAALNSKKEELRKINDLITLHGESVVITCGLNLFIGKKSWNLYTYNKKEFTFAQGMDNMHTFAFQSSQKLGVEKYDFCGFSGSTDKTDPYYGLYHYKSSFGSEFTEYLGEFDFIISTQFYNFFLMSYRYHSKIKRKLSTLLYKKEK